MPITPLGRLNSLADYAIGESNPGKGWTGISFIWLSSSWLDAEAWSCYRETGLLPDADFTEWMTILRALAWCYSSLRSSRFILLPEASVFLFWRVYSFDCDCCRSNPELPRYGFHTFSRFFLICSMMEFLLVARPIIFEFGRCSETSIIKGNYSESILVFGSE